ncbi:MAG TPA: response regulator [Candidatus Thermoplasmatota archaeon]|nr:response regulator [Candidatus Thermoplasmatota archaeon]
MALGFRRILHIEDSETDAYIVKRAFRDEKEVSIAWATTGAQGVQKALDEDYDLVLLDYALPDMTGLEVLLHLSDKRPDLPVILVSGFGSEYVAARGLQVGAIGYVNKDAPHFREELAQTLQRLYEQGEQRRKARAVEDRIRQRPNLRRHMEDVLGTLRQALPEARGTFLTSSDGLPLAVSRSDGSKDVDPLSAMVTGGILRNLDMVGGSLQLDEQESGMVRYKGGALVYRKLPEVGSLVVVFDREADPRDDLREVDVAAREIQTLVRDEGA